MIFLSLLALLLGGIAYAFYKIIIEPFYYEWKYPIPGPKRPSWIFGHFLTILKAEPSEPLLEWMNHYSQSKIVRYFIGPSMRIAAADPDSVKAILWNQKVYSKDIPDYTFLAEITGYSLLTTSDIEFHKTQRKLCNVAFKYEKVVNFVPLYEGQVHKLIDKWNSAISSSTKNEICVNMVKDMGALTLDIIGLAAFDYQLNSLQNSSILADNYLGLFKTFRRSPLLLIPGYRKIPFAHVRKRNQLLANITQTVQHIITERRKDIADGKPLKGDLLSILLQEKISDTELRDLCLTFMVAGHETTSMHLTWTLYALARYPDIQQKCRDEIKPIITRDGRVTKENINEFTYLSNTMNESFRLYAPVPLIVRNTEEDTTLGGYAIPKGSRVVVSAGALHRTQKYWKDPEVFDPDRWINNSHAGWFYPFIDGPRNCIGQKFALLEAIVILANLLNNYSFKLVDTSPVKKRQVVTLHPDPDMMLYVSKVE